MSSGSVPPKKKKPVDRASRKPTPSDKERNANGHLRGGSSPSLDLGITGRSAAPATRPSPPTTAGGGQRRPASTLGFYPNTSSSRKGAGAQASPSLSPESGVRDNNPFLAVNVAAKNRAYEQRIEELQGQLDTTQAEANQKSQALHRLRDENNRLRRLQAAESSASTLSIARQLSQALDVSLPASLSEEQVIEALLENVLRKVQEAEGLTTQIAQLEGNVEDMCSKLATDQARADTLATELDRAKRSLSEKCRETADIQVKATATTEEITRNSSQLEAVKTQLAALQSRAHQSEESRARCEAQRALAETKLAALTSGKSDAETRLQELSTECAEARQSAETWRTRHNDRMRKVTDCLLLGGTATDEEIMQKILEKSRSVQELSESNRNMKSIISGLETELKANRETIMRMVKEAETQQNVAVSRNEDMERKEMEKEEVLVQVQGLEYEVHLLKSELDATQERLADAEQNAASKDDEISGLEKTVLQLQEARYQQDVTLAGLRHDIAEAAIVGIAGNSRSAPDQGADSKDLTKRMRSLSMEARSETQKSAALQEEIVLLQKDLETEQIQNEQLREQVDDLNAQLGSQQDAEEMYECQLKIKDGTCKSLESEHAQHSYFCKRLSDLMKLDQLTKDFGSGMQTEAIIGRVDQLLRQETNALAEKSTSIYNLRRTLKTTKTNLESKDLHNKLLEQNSIRLTKRLEQLTKESSDKQEEIKKCKNDVKLMKKQAATLREQEGTIRELGGRLDEANKFQVTTLEQAAAMQSLEQQLATQHAQSKKQTQQLSSRQKTLEASKVKSETERQQVQHECESLRAELGAAQTALDEVSTRERQLLNMRSTMAMMMGLNVAQLSVPDYEILARLETVVKAHEAHVSTARGVQSALQQLQQNFYTGYDEAMQLVGDGGGGGGGGGLAAPPGRPGAGDTRPAPPANRSRHGQSPGRPGSTSRAQSRYGQSQLP